MDNMDGYKTIICELEKSLARQAASLDGIKTSSRTILTSSSIIFSLATFLQYSKLTFNEPTGTIVKIALAFFFLIIIGISIYVNFPTVYNAPIKPDWEVQKKAFLNKTEEEILRMKISATLNAYQKNEPVINLYSIFVTISGASLAALLIILAASPFFSKP